jgi:hypothetical protein
VGGGGVSVGGTGVFVGGGCGVGVGGSDVGVSTTGACAMTGWANIGSRMRPNKHTNVARIISLVVAEILIKNYSSGSTWMKRTNKMEVSKQ